MTDRDAARSAFICRVLGQDWHVVKSSADASFRSYYRLKCGARTVMLMDAPPDREPLAPFVDVANRLCVAGVRVPEILHQDIVNGFAVLEDFGDGLFADLLSDSPNSVLSRAVSGLERLSRADHEGLPRYDDALLRQELDLFSHWFVHRQLGRDPVQELGGWWEDVCDVLVANALEQPVVLVHRDYHCGNLMLTPDGEMGVLDFQDAVAGPLTYDSASLLWDRYVSWAPEDLARWSRQTHQVVSPATPYSSWQRWMDLMGLQRNLKVVGIFARLNLRDGKSRYLDWQPRFFGYCKAVASAYPEFRPLAHYLQQLDLRRELIH